MAKKSFSCAGSLHAFESTPKHAGATSVSLFLYASICLSVYVSAQGNSSSLLNNHPTELYNNECTCSPLPQPPEVRRLRARHRARLRACLIMEGSEPTWPSRRSSKYRQLWSGTESPAVTPTGPAAPIAPRCSGKTCGCTYEGEACSSRRCSCNSTGLSCTDYCRCEGGVSCQRLFSSKQEAMAREEREAQDIDWRGIVRGDPCLALAEKINIA